MNPDPNHPPSAPGLQFEKAEFTKEAALPCAVCKVPIQGEFYQINGQTVCASCRKQADVQLTGGTPLSRFGLALMAGIVAAGAGVFVYWAVSVITHAHWSIVAIAVGYMVGYAVRWGSRSKGGLPYQFLALMLTYCAIAASFMHYFLSPKSDLLDYLTAFGEAAVLPLKEGASAILLWVIIAIGLHQAWTMNRRLKFQVSGPFFTRQSSPPAAT
jgi:hypothetical protein